MKPNRNVILTVLMLAVAPLPAPARVRVLMPAAPAALPIARELPAIIDEYNRALPPDRAEGHQVQLLRRGEGFSALKELMALSLAGDAPDLAGIEPHEFPAIEATRLPRPFPAEVVALARPVSGRQAVRILPFERTVPVLVWNPELLKVGEPFRDLKALVSYVPSAAGGKIAVPLQGARGLWLLEAILGQPLWKRELGGLRSNRELAPPLAELQGAPGLAPDSWESSVQAFIDRKAPALLASSDALPLIQAQARFGWKARVFAPPAPGGTGTLVTGTDLVALRESVEVWAFLRYLYSPRVAARWAGAGGFWPLQDAWTREPSWKASAVSSRGVFAPPPRRPRFRTTDAEVVRASTEWISALRAIFGEKRLPLDTVFDQLDATLGAKPGP